MSDPTPKNSPDSPQNSQTSHPDSAPEQQHDQAVDPRDLVYKGGYGKNPREIVENPAVTPQMLDEPQQSRGGFIRDDGDEADSSPS